MSVTERNKIKKELLEMCKANGAGKKTLRFSAPKRWSITEKPTSLLKYKGYTFKMRYAPEFETPFYEDQDPNAEPILNIILFEDYELYVSNSDKTLASYLMLHPHCDMMGGKWYGIENKEKEAEDELIFMEKEEQARNKARTEGLETVQAVYDVLTGRSASSVTPSEIRVTIIKLAKENPDVVLEAFGDEKTIIKYKYKSAVELGHIYTTNQDTVLKWKDSNGTILNIPAGASMPDEFAKFCLSDDKGNDVLEALQKKLAN
jgi:hypothetical protein